MEFYTWLDLISGIGCLFFVMAYTFKRSSFHPERRLIFLFVVLGVGFFIRGWCERNPALEAQHWERACFMFFPLSATLYVEQMARLKLPIGFKLFVLLALPLTLTVFAFDRTVDGRPAAITLMIVEIITFSLLSVFTVAKISSTPRGIERSITIALLVFIVASGTMVILDWYFHHILNLPRASSIVVFPFSYFAFRISYSARGFSNRRAWRDAGLEIVLAALQSYLVHMIWGLSFRDALILGILFIYVRITMRTIALIWAETEDRRAYFTMAQINALSRTKPKEFLAELEKIENVHSARFIGEGDFKELGLEKVYVGLFDTLTPCSREEIVKARLEPADDSDSHAVARMEHALDAFRFDFLYAVPGTQVCFGIRFDDFNQDAAISERAYAIFTQASLMWTRNGGAPHG
jgi:hypothetical protein